MLTKIDHIGIAVESLEESSNFFKNALGLKLSKIEVVKDQKVKVAIFPIGECRIELLEATSPESPIAKFIEKKGQGIHHISFHTDDINKELKNLKDKGIALIDKEPRLGADEAKIAFLHPKSTFKVLMELLS